MIFALWALTWVYFSTTASMLLVPLLATCARASFLKRPFFTSATRLPFLWLVVMFPAILFAASYLGGDTLENAYLPAIKIPVAALCLNHVVMALGNIDLRQFFPRTEDRASEHAPERRLTRRSWLDEIRSACGICALVFDRCIDIHGRNIRALFYSVKLRMRVDRSLRGRLGILRLGVTAFATEMLRLINDFWQVISSAGSVPDLSLWAVGGTGARLRPMGDIALLALPLLAVWLGVPAIVPSRFRDVLEFTGLHFA